MATIDKQTLKFLKDLKSYNYREWFKENKDRYDRAATNFSDFIGALLKELSKFDPGISGLEPKDCIFRIYRDTRFAKDKSPYKTNMGAHILANGRKTEHSQAGYYVHLEPGNSFLAGGAYRPPAAWIKNIRQEIDRDAATFKKIISTKTFREYFGALEGEKLKTAPKGFPKDHPEIDLLRFKSFLAVHQVIDKQLLAPDYLKYSVKVFKALSPFDDFLNRGT